MTSNTQQKPVTSHKIDLSLCTLCELCITICPAAVPSKNEKKEVFFQSDKVEFCIRCGHCMAMCEAAAISIDGLSVESMIVGYPKFPFKRAIIRPRTNVTYISSE